jgi:subfamily B ATP-binding cassette protein MsbA
MIGTAATEPLFPALMKPMLDGGFAAGTSAALPPAVFAVAIIAIFFVRGILSLVSAYAMAWVSNRVVLDLRGEMFAPGAHADAVLRRPHIRALLPGSRTSPE